jgi:glutamyl-tRNA synthetase
MEIRVRFAPSPTGPLHIGGVRTALFNYLFAKKNKGKFILRIEDTDQNRYVNGAEEYIIKSLDWLGLKFDEGVTIGGEYAPYRQSERRDIYKKHIQQLLDSGQAYYAFDTAEELDQMRKNLEQQKSSVRHYNFITRTKMKNSFTLSDDEVKKRINSGQKYVVRFNMPQNKEIILHDIIRGEIKINTSSLDDKILFKSDGLPTYHLANIVDDHLMKITHVIRGEEWLPSLALHYMLYNAFGWKPPKFAHLPLILKPTGKGKLSKRDGDQGGFPVFPLEWTDPKTGEKISGYKEKGYLPEAVINMLAFLGWNPGNDTEIMSLNELIKNFDLEKVQKAGARFDPEKAKWFNQQHLKNIPTEKLVENFIPILQKKGINTDKNYITKIINLTRDRLTFEHELWENTNYFFIAPDNYDPKSLKKHWKQQSPQYVKKALEYLKNTDNFDAKYLEENMIKWINEQNINLGKILNPLRLLLVGKTAGPHIFDIMELLGKNETIKRIELGLNKLQN